MEPITAATTFSSFVGLLALFKSERKGQGEDEYKEFLEWLESKRYNNLIEEITSNHQLSLSIKMLVKQNHEEFIEKFNTIEHALTHLASSIEGFKELSLAIAPNSELSDQAISTIKQLNDSGGSCFLEIQTMAGNIYQVTDAEGSIDFNEPRYIEDDLGLLVELNLLRLDYNSKGSRLFYLTRSASKLAQAWSK